MTDRIVYTVVHAAGGVDGLDSSAKAFITKAFFEKEAALQAKGQDSRLSIEPIVVDVDQVQRDVMARMTAIERLIFNPAGHRAKPIHDGRGPG